MNKIIIIADSTCDLEPEYVEKNDIVLTPLHVSFAGDDHDYLDGVDIDSETVYKKVVESGNTPKTGAKNIGELIELFKKYVDQGCDIIFTGIGSGLSSTYNNAMIAKQEFDDDRIEVVDSQNLSTGIGLLVSKMVKYRDEGLNIHEIAAKVRELVPLVSAKFCIDRLDYLYKGGRCSGMTKIFAHALKIHPVAKVIDGKLTVYKKPRGLYRKAVDEQIEEFLKDYNDNNIDLDNVFVTDSGHMDGEDNYIIKRLSEIIDPKIIRHTRAGCVVSSHCGPKTIGILYILKRKN